MKKPEGLEPKSDFVTPSRKVRMLRFLGVAAEASFTGVGGMCLGAIFSQWHMHETPPSWAVAGAAIGATGLIAMNRKRIQEKLAPSFLAASHAVKTKFIEKTIAYLGAGTTAIIMAGIGAGLLTEGARSHNQYLIGFGVLAFASAAIISGVMIIASGGKVSMK